MTRREFLKKLFHLAISFGTYPVLSYAKSLELGKDVIKGAHPHITGCMWCQNGCSMIVYIKDGKVVHLTGNPDDSLTKGRICIKPFGSLEILKSPYRLKYPMKRVGGVGDKAKFVKMSWEKILSEIGERLKIVREKYSPETLGIWASGRSAFDGRLLSRAFAKLYGTNNWEKTGPFCNFSGKIAGILTVGTGHTPWIYSSDDFYNASLYIFLGSNMAATRPVIFQILKERKMEGRCKIICIDPRLSETAKYADIWLPIKPGTDMALALGLIHYILENNMEDKEFIKNHSFGFEKFKMELFKRGYNVRWASKVTDIPEDDIKNLAYLYTNTKKAIIVGNADISHHTNAVQTHRAFYFLAAITGHFGEKSMGCACLNNGGCKIGSIDVPKNMIKKSKTISWQKSSNVVRVC